MRRLAILLAPLLLLSLVLVPGPSKSGYHAKTSVIVSQAERYTEVLRYRLHVSRDKVRSIVHPQHHRRVYVSVRQYAYNLIGSQFACFDHVINAESTWNPRARNGQYYGLGQLRQYIPDPYRQVQAVDKYMMTRYGSPCSAWSFHLQHGWY